MKLSCPLAIPFVLVHYADAQAWAPPQTPGGQSYTPYVVHLGAAALSPGESKFDELNESIALNSKNEIIFAGSTRGSVIEPNAGYEDLLLGKIGTDGRLVWLRQVGLRTAPTIPAINGDPTGPGGEAGGSDRIQSVAIDVQDNIFVTGWTMSSLGETHAKGPDVFVGKWSDDGVLLGLRQIGAETASSIPSPGGDATETDHGLGVAIDVNGDVVICGQTMGDLAETNGGFNVGDAFIARFDADCHLRYVSQIGQQTANALGLKAGGWEMGQGIDLASNGDILVVGQTDWALAEPSGGGHDLFLARFDGGGKLRGIRQLGASLGPASAGDEFACSVVVDRADHVYVAGDTQGDLGEPNAGGRDAFVARFDAGLNLQWISQVGQVAASDPRLGIIDATQDEYVQYDRLIAASPHGGVILAGSTWGSLGEQNSGRSDMFVARFSDTGRVDWITQVGADTATAIGVDPTQLEYSRSVLVDPYGSIYVGGVTKGHFLDTNPGWSKYLDVLVLRMSPHGQLH